MAGRLPGWMLLGAGVAVVGGGVGLAALVRALERRPPLVEAAVAYAPLAATVPIATEIDPAPVPRRPRRAPTEITRSDDLTRAEIVATMGRVKPRAAACLEEGEPRALVSVKMTISSSGRVVAAKVEGPLEGTETAACVESAARSASFRPSKRLSTTLTWPFLLGEP